MTKVDNQTLNSNGLSVQDIGWVTGEFDPFDKVSGGNGTKIYEQELDCYREVSDMLVQWSKTKVGSFDCRGNSFFIIGGDAAIVKTEPIGIFAQMLAGLSDFTVAIWNNIVVPMQPQPPVANISLTDLEFATLSSDLSNFLKSDERHRLAHYCSCDYYIGVCETKTVDKVDACVCDPDCKTPGEGGILKNPCEVDDHCDSWCPPLADMDCMKAFSLGAAASPAAPTVRVPKPAPVYKEPKETVPSYSASYYLKIPEPPKRIYVPICTTKYNQVIEQNCGWSQFGYNHGTGRPQVTHYCIPVPKLVPYTECN